VQQISSLKASIAALQHQLEQQEQQAAARAADRDAAFKRQLDVEKRQHESTKQNCKLLTDQNQQLQERVTAAEAREGQLQLQLDRLQQQLEEVMCTSHADASQGQLQQVQQLHQQIRQQKDEVTSLQDCLQRLYRRVRSAGVLSPPGQGSDDKEGRPAADDLMPLVEASIQQLVSGITNQPAKELHRLQRSEQQLQQEVERLSAVNVQCEAAMQQQIAHLQQYEQVLQELQLCQQQCEQLSNACQQKQKQLDEAQSQRQLLMERIRELADRVATFETAKLNGSAVADGGGPAPEHTQLSATCSGLSQEVQHLRSQLADSQSKEERLHVAIAKLQESVAGMQVGEVKFNTCSPSNTSITC